MIDVYKLMTINNKNQASLETLDIRFSGMLDVINDEKLMHYETKQEVIAFVTRNLNEYKQIIKETKDEKIKF